MGVTDTDVLEFHSETPVSCGDGTLAERYEQTISRLERIMQAGYQVKVQGIVDLNLPKT